MKRKTKHFVQKIVFTIFICVFLYGVLSLGFNLIWLYLEGHILYYHYLFPLDDQNEITWFNSIFTFILYGFLLQYWIRSVYKKVCSQSPEKGKG